MKGSRVWDLGLKILRFGVPVERFKEFGPFMGPIAGLKKSKRLQSRGTDRIPFETFLSSLV